MARSKLGRPTLTGGVVTASRQRGWGITGGDDGAISCRDGAMEAVAGTEAGQRSIIAVGKVSASSIQFDADLEPDDVASMETG